MGWFSILLNEHKTLTREHYKIFGISWAGWVFDFYDLMLFTYLTVALQADLGLTPMMISVCISVSLLATAVGGILCGILGDKYGRKRVLQWTIIIYSIGAFLCGFAWSFGSLVLFRIITGIGVGGEWATGQTFINETFPPHLRGRFGALMQSGAPVGIILAAIVGNIISPIIGWRFAFMLSVIPAFIVILIRRRLNESDVWIENKKENKNPGSIAEVKALISQGYRKYFIISLILCIFGMAAYWFTYSWLPTYLSKERGLTIVGSTIGIIIMQCGDLVGYSSFGIVSEKIGKRLSFTIYSFIMAIGITLITLFWNQVSADNLILLVLFIVGVGVGFFSGFGPLFSELFPTKIRNTAVGTIFNLARGVQFVTPLLITLISSYYDLSYGIFVAAIFALLTGIWIWVFPNTDNIDINELDEC